MHLKRVGFFGMTIKHILGWVTKTGGNSVEHFESHGCPFGLLYESLENKCDKKFFLIQLFLKPTM